MKVFIAVLEIRYRNERKDLVESLLKIFVGLQRRKKGLKDPAIADCRRSIIVARFQREVRMLNRIRWF